MSDLSRAAQEAVIRYAFPGWPIAPENVIRITPFRSEGDQIGIDVFVKRDAYCSCEPSRTIITSPDEMFAVMKLVFE